MRIVAFVAFVAVFAVATACGGERETAPQRAASTVVRPASQGEPVLALVYPPGGEGPIELTRVDQLTLEPVSEPVPLDVDWLSRAMSPDGKLLAIGNGETPRIELFDAKRLSRVDSVELPNDGAGGAWQLSWARPGPLFAAVGESGVVTVDPRTRRVTAARRVDGVLLGGLAKVDGGVAALVAPRGRIGPLALAVMRPDRTASVSLGQIVGGWENEEGDGPEDFTSREASPALAVDPSGRRALVVPARGDVAEVDLETLRVTYRALSRPVSALGRLRNWLEPAAQAKSVTGWSRTALWTSEDVVVVTGVDHADKPAARARPAGLSFIDTRDWSIRTEEGDVAELFPAGENLLAFEWACAGTEESYGLIVYDAKGIERFRRCEEEGFDAVVVEDRVYLGYEDNRRYEIVDATTGDVLATPRAERTTTILGD